MDIDKGLIYACSHDLGYADMYLPLTPFLYTPPSGGFVNGDQAEYNAITWLDSRNKPDWNDITYYEKESLQFWPIWRAQTLIDTKEPTITTGTSAQYYRGDKTWQTLPTVSARSFANPTRALNGTAFQISATRDAAVSYSVDITCALSLSGGQAGTVYLRYADDSGFTTNITEVCRTTQSNTGTLTVGLALSQVATGTLSGIIPAGKYVKLVTANDTGTPTFTYRRAQEVLL